MRASDCQMETDDYVDSNEWKLLEHPAKKNVIKYPCCVEPYPDLTYTIRVKRIAVFYSFILVLPCVLLSSPPLLTVCGLQLHPGPALCPVIHADARLVLATARITSQSPSRSVSHVFNDIASRTTCGRTNS